MLSYFLFEHLGRFYEGEVGRPEVGGGRRKRQVNARLYFTDEIKTFILHLQYIRTILKHFIVTKFQLYCGSNIVQYILL